MRLFLDTADVKEIKKWAESGFIDGVTTNPSLVATANRPYEKLLKEICAMVEGPVSAEVMAPTWEAMVTEGLAFSKIAENIAVKVPMTVDGLRACRVLAEQEGLMVNVTLCFSPSQALLAANAGATFISPFIGRLDDISQDGAVLIQDIKEIYDHDGGYETLILAASIRHPQHVVEVAKAGADIATIPPKILEQLFHHPLTDKGIQIFQEDWKQLSSSR